MTSAKIQTELNKKAHEISKEYDDAPTLIIVAGTPDAKVTACTTGRANLGEGREGRMRDLLGILEAAKQIEAHIHLHEIGIPAVMMVSLESLKSAGTPSPQ